MGHAFTVTNCKPNITQRKYKMRIYTTSYKDSDGSKTWYNTHTEALTKSENDSCLAKGAGLGLGFLLIGPRSKDTVSNFPFGAFKQNIQFKKSRLLIFMDWKIPEPVHATVLRINEQLLTDCRQINDQRQIWWQIYYVK